MKVTPYAQAVRSISAEFGRRLYLPVVITTVIIWGVLVGITIWLVTLSAWWWLLLVPLIVVGVIGAIVALVIAGLLRFLRPAQSADQRVAVRAFVDALQEAAETLQTPRIFLLFRVVKDAVFPGQQGFLKQVTSNIGSLKPDFMAIVDSFRPR